MNKFLDATGLMHYHSKIDDELSNISDKIGYSAIIKEYTQTLVAGETCVVFEGVAAYEDATINIYTTKFEIEPRYVEIVGNDIHVYFLRQDEDMGVRIALTSYLNPEFGFIRIVTKDLPAGDTTLVFENVNLTEDSNIEIYTTEYGEIPNYVTLDQEANTLTLTFKEHDEVIGVKLFIR